MIEKTSDISDSMFKRGESNPAVNFAAYPYPNSALSESVIAIDGIDYRYRNGPQEWMNFTWPGQNPGGRVRGVRVGNLASAELATDGPWALMRLLDKAHISSVQGGSFLATWSLLDSSGQRMSISFRIKPDRSAALLQTGALQGYRLPAEVFLRQAVVNRND